MEPHLESNQHGFLPGRGTLTAWRDILSRAISKPDIYEFDYKGFFDSLMNMKVLNLLKDVYGLPVGWWRRLRDISQSVPQLCEVDLMYEPDRNSYFTVYDSPGKGGKSYVTTFRESGGMTSRGYKWRGFPQGAPISPLLSIIPLMWLDQRVNLHRDRIRYADDFIEFPRGGSTKQWSRLPGTSAMNKLPKAFRNFGISYSLEKSGWVKRDGVWLKPLKFLGLTYDGQRDELTAATRNGATLSIHSKDALLRALLSGPKRRQSSAEMGSGKELGIERLLKSERG